jgi:hypothetical protein
MLPGDRELFFIESKPKPKSKAEPYRGSRGSTRICTDFFGCVLDEFRLKFARAKTGTLGEEFEHCLKSAIEGERCDDERRDTGGDMAGGGGTGESAVARGAASDYGSEPLPSAGRVSDAAGSGASGRAGTESEGREDQHGRFAGGLEECGGEAGKKAVAGGVCAGGQVQCGGADGAVR